MTQFVVPNDRELPEEKMELGDGELEAILGGSKGDVHYKITLTNANISSVTF